MLDRWVEAIVEGQIVSPSSPRVWNRRIGPLCLAVVHHRDIAPDQWVMRCGGLSIQEWVTGGDLEQWQKELEQRVSRVVQEIQGEVSDA